jgi:hypothetical protein
VKTRGRPKLFDGPPVSVRLPSAAHDALSHEALERRITVADVIRERLGVATFVSQKLTPPKYAAH